MPNKALHLSNQYAALLRVPRQLSLVVSVIKNMYKTILKIE